MLIAGFSYKETEEATGINEDTLRSMKCRALKKSGATKKADVAPKKEVETEIATLETKIETLATHQETKIETAANAQKRDLNAENASVLSTFAADFVANFHPADLLFYGVVLIGCNGITKALQPVGIFVAVALFGVATISLHGLKTLSGWARLPHGVLMLVSEFAFFVSDLKWANEALWSNVKGLPLDIWANKYRNDLGEVVMLYGGSDVDKPFYIAVGVASVLAACAAYACIIALQGKRP